MTPMETPELTERCQQFFEASPKPTIVVSGPEHLVRYLNLAFTGLTGISGEQIINHAFALTLPDIDKLNYNDLLNGVYISGAEQFYTEHKNPRTGSVLSCWNIQAWVVRGFDLCPIGLVIQIEDTTETTKFRHEVTALNQALLLTSVKQHEFISSIEASERDKKELLSQLLQLQKLESLGIMAKGIAHDLNNILTPILGYAELASEISVGHSTSSYVEEIITHSRLAASLVQQILLYTGEGDINTMPVDLSAVIRDMKNLFHAGISVKASIRYELSASLPVIVVDPMHMRQVMMSLIHNAIEAIVESGDITIKTEMVKSNGLDIPTSVALEVSDTGCGISPYAIDKIFDPFYSTKFVGRGLGLAVVQGIVKLYRGSIEVQSEPNRGTRFRIVFPASDDKLL